MNNNRNNTPLRDHLIQRKVDLDLYRPVIDEATNTATFYLWNLSGEVVGYQQYKPDKTKTCNNDPKEGRYFTYKRNKHTIAMFGVESLKYDGPLFVTEGAFDSTPLTIRHCAALATLSNAPPWFVRSFLWNIGKRPIIVVRDADKAGKELEPFGDIVVTVPEKYGDLGNAPDEWVDDLVKQYKGVNGYGT